MDHPRPPAESSGARRLAAWAALGALAGAARGLLDVVGPAKPGSAAWALADRAARTAAASALAVALAARLARRLGPASRFESGGARFAAVAAILAAQLATPIDEPSIIMMIFSALWALAAAAFGGASGAAIDRLVPDPPRRPQAGQARNPIEI